MGRPSVVAGISGPLLPCKNKKRAVILLISQQFTALFYGKKCFGFYKEYMVFAVPCPDSFMIEGSGLALCPFESQREN